DGCEEMTKLNIAVLFPANWTLPEPCCRPYTTKSAPTPIPSHAACDRQADRTCQRVYDTPVKARSYAVAFSSAVLPALRPFDKPFDPSTSPSTGSGEPQGGPGSGEPQGRHAQGARQQGTSRFICSPRGHAVFSLCERKNEKPGTLWVKDKAPVTQTI